MNPMNLLFSFVFAKSSAEKYHVSDTQKLQSTALLSGMATANPILSYLIIDNEAKKLQSVPNSPIITTPSTETPATTSTDTNIEKIVTKVISERIAPAMLRSDNPKLESLKKEILDATLPYLIKEQMVKLESFKQKFESILSHKLLDRLDVESLVKLEELKEIFISKNIINKEIELLKMIQSASDFNLYLPSTILLEYRIEKMLSDIEYKLKDLEMGYEANSGLEAVSDTVAKEKSTATKVTSVKK